MGAKRANGTGGCQGGRTVAALAVCRALLLHSLNVDWVSSTSDWPGCSVLMIGTGSQLEAPQEAGELECATASVNDDIPWH